MTEFNKKLTELKSQQGEHQRLVIDVPSPGATLLMGKRSVDQPAFGYSGVSLRSAQNFFVDIAQRTLFQGHEAITFQTAQSWTQYSTGPTVVFAKGHVDVTSATSVVVAAVADRQHNPPVGADMKPNNGETVEAVATFDDLRDGVLGDQKSALGGWRLLASDIGRAKGKLGAAYQSDEVTSLADQAKHLVDQMKAGAAVQSGIGMVSEHAIATFSKTATMTVAQSGVTLVAGSNSEQADVTALASRALTLRSGKSAEMYSNGKLSLAAGKSADVAAVGAMAVSSRGGSAYVLGKDVFVGSRNPDIGLSDGSKQKPTKTVTLAADETARIDSAKNVDVVGLKKVTLTVGAFQVVIESSTLKIGNIDGHVTVQVTNSDVTVAAGTHTIKVNADAGVKVSSGGNDVTIGPSGVSVKGSAINLG